jgi:hypothetical protein
MVFSVTEGFLNPSVQDAPRNGTSHINEASKAKVVNHMFHLHQAEKLERLSAADCVNAYAQNYQSARGNLLLVVSNSTQEFTNGSVATFDTQVAPVTSLEDFAPDPFGWICKQLGSSHGKCANSISQVQREIGNWRPFGSPVQYCMSETVDQHCRVEYTAHLLLVVVLIGLLKTGVMLFIAFRIRDVPLLTIGDAVSSFLTDPEPKTKGMCLLDRSLKQFKPSVTGIQQTGLGEHNSLSWKTPPQYFHDRRKRRFIAASGRRWAAFLVTFIVLLGAAIFLLQYSVYWYTEKGGNTSRIYTDGFGNIDPRAFISWSLPTSGVGGLVSNVIVANTPQLLLSFLYLNYNGVMTVMSLAREFSRYGLRQNGLRVSANPRGAQRSTYFLQPPYRFGIPIIVATSVLHWLLSQSIFLVSTEAIMLKSSNNTDSGVGDIEIWDTQTPRQLMTCGYSPPAILASICVASLLLIGVVAMSFVKLPSSMPVAASCSAAIAAACHVSIDEVDEISSEKKVMWGIIGGDKQGIGHCAFSIREVERPEDGKLYA